jgi:exonuclease III
VNRASLSIINVNCQSAKAKKLPLHHMIHTVKPDIVIGTESWLKKEDLDDECAPKDQYEVYRKDRTHAKGGGVFIAVRRDLITEKEPELDADCELIWCKISIVGLKTLHIGAYYRPHEGDEASLDELQKSLVRLGDTDQSYT